MPTDDNAASLEWAESSLEYARSCGPGRLVELLVLVLDEILFEMGPAGDSATHGRESRGR
ncbi:MAG TPA: hypothetical protein VFJ72_04290 [Rubrobacteraceae bacterium]|nr:hypothetical protein [Rubrobacteraceae bacterium]